MTQLFLEMIKGSAITLFPPTQDNNVW